MNLQDWKIIHTLYSVKNITKTANELFISQPALTNRIKIIEEKLSTTLVIRHRRGVQFTIEGEYLAQCASDMLKQHQQIQENLANLKSTVSGTLRLGVSKYFAKYKIPKLLRLFKTEYPDVEFQVVTGWSGDIYKSITNRDVHIGFVRGDYPWREGQDLLLVEKICAASTKSFEWSDLPSMPRIVYDTDYKLNAIVENWWAENYKSPPNISIEVDQVDTCKEMIVNDLGYGILPTITVSDLPDLYKKTLLDKNGNPLIRKTFLYYHADTLSINMVQAFISFVQKIDFKVL